MQVHEDHEIMDASDRTHRETRAHVSLSVLISRIMVSLLAFTSNTTAENYPSPQPFFEACHSSDLATVTKTLSHYPYLAKATSRHGDHCIHIVSSNGNVDILQVLLERGANPNIKTIPKGNKISMMHPLGWSAILGQSEAIELLLDYGANVNALFVLETEHGEGRKVTALDAAEIMSRQYETGESKEEDAPSLGKSIMGRAKKHLEGGDGGGQISYAEAIRVLVRRGAKRSSELKRNERL